MRYMIFIQLPNEQHVAYSPIASEADKLARWAHKAGGAACLVYETHRNRVRLTLGDFDESRT